MTGGEVVYFFAVAGLLIVGAYFAVRWLGRGFSPAGAGRRMVIRETMGLGPRSGLCLVEVDGRRLVVGFGQSGMSLICDLGAGPEGAPVPPATGGDDPEEQHPTAPPRFKGFLAMADSVNRWLRAGAGWAGTGRADGQSRRDAGRTEKVRPVNTEMSKVEEAIRSLEQTTQGGTTRDDNRRPGRGQ